MGIVVSSIPNQAVCSDCTREQGQMLSLALCTLCHPSLLCICLCKTQQAGAPRSKRVEALLIGDNKRVRRKTEQGVLDLRERSHRQSRGIPTYACAHTVRAEAMVAATQSDLQDLTELFHDVGHWPAAWPVGLAEDGSQLLHCFGSGA